MEQLFNLNEQHNYDKGHMQAFVFDENHMGFKFGAVYTQELIRKHWPEVKKVIDLEFPYIRYTPGYRRYYKLDDSFDFAPIQCSGCTDVEWVRTDNTEKIVPTPINSGGHYIVLNPIFYEQDYTDSVKICNKFEMPLSMFPLFVFCHELQHLKQHCGGTITATLKKDMSKVQRFWNGKAIGRYNLHWEKPEEIDSNTTAGKIISTIDPKAKFDFKVREEIKDLKKHDTVGLLAELFKKIAEGK